MCHIHSNTHPKVTPAIPCNRNENLFDFHLGNKYSAPFQTEISDWDLQRKNLLAEKMVWMQSCFKSEIHHHLPEPKKALWEQGNQKAWQLLHHKGIFHRLHARCVLELRFKLRTGWAHKPGKNAYTSFNPIQRTLSSLLPSLTSFF